VLYLSCSIHLALYPDATLLTLQPNQSTNQPKPPQPTQTTPNPQVHQGLRSARSSVLAVLPAVAAESYTRAYPLVAKLHMLTEVEEAFALMARVGFGFSVLRCLGC